VRAAPAPTRPPPARRLVLHTLCAHTSRYDIGLLEENVVVLWSRFCGEKYEADRKVRDAAAPFIKWLRGGEV